jgi:hypothetical protein
MTSTDLARDQAPGADVDRNASTPADRAAIPVLGWKEHVVLPEWGLRLRGKLDTGARSSALHVTAMEELGDHTDAETGERFPVVRFDVVLGRKSNPIHHEVTAPIIGHKIVRDTGARAETRPVVRTRIVCGPLDTTAEITLTDRTGMNFRMLLGRLTLEHRALVDPAHGYLMTGRGRPRQVPR